MIAACDLTCDQLDSYSSQVLQAAGFGVRGFLGVALRVVQCPWIAQE